MQRAKSLGDGAMYDSWKQLEWEGRGEKWKTKPQETNEQAIKRRMAACAEDSWQAGEEGNGLLNVVQRR